MELFANCEKYMRWIKREGFELDNLQAAADFAGDLVRCADELREFLTEELKRSRGGLS